MTTAAPPPPPTQLLDLPDAILTQICSLITDVRSRNSLSLASLKLLSLERSTRLSLSLRGNLLSPSSLLRLPLSFPSVTSLDLSCLSPWGSSFAAHSHSNLAVVEEHNNKFYSSSAPKEIIASLIAARLRQAFPSVVSLTLYARGPSSLPVAFPSLRHLSLVRWHQRPPLDSPDADLAPIFASCPLLSSLDLSRFYYWTYDVVLALQNHPFAATSLTHLDLLSPSLSDGFGSSELTSLSAACPNLKLLRAPCVFNPMHFDSVGDDALLAVAASCPLLTVLNLVDPAAQQIPDSEAQQQQDSRISCSALEKMFLALPKLEDFAMNLCHRVLDCGRALEVLGNNCLKMRVLRLGRFEGICKAAGLHLDGVAVCGGLEELCVWNSSDLTDSSLLAIARGCRRLKKFEIHGCGGVTESGVRRMTEMLRSTLVDVRLSGCLQLNTAACLRALMPVRDRIESLHVDCNWADHNEREAELVGDVIDNNFDETDEGCLPSKRCRYSDHEDEEGHYSNGYIDPSWHRLRFLSLWLPAGEILSPLPGSGLESCPNLEEIHIKVEGDCRTCPRPSQGVFGLSSLVLYPSLSKMKLDCGDAIGFAFTAPMGQMDLSLWERFYLNGIGELRLYELDYWPPQDRDVNQRSLSLPATALIQGCVTLRKLFIHGTAHEHFMRFFLQMPVLRDVQLREDYYPAPENDMSTEMRVDSCSRFEDALNSREIPD